MIVASAYRVTSLPAPMVTPVSAQGAVLTSTRTLRTKDVYYDVASTTINPKARSGTSGIYKPSSSAVYYMPASSSSATVTSSAPTSTKPSTLITHSTSAWGFAQTSYVQHSNTGTIKPTATISSICYTCGNR